MGIWKGAVRADALALPSILRPQFWTLTRHPSPGHPSRSSDASVLRRRWRDEPKRSSSVDRLRSEESCPSGEPHLQSRAQVCDPVPGTGLIPAGGAGRTRSSRSRPGSRRSRRRIRRRRGARERPALVDGDRQPAAQGRSGRCSVAGPAQLLPAVGQQLVDPVGWMRADATEHIAELRPRVDPQILAGRAQTHQDRRRLSPPVAPRE
jgi:hypothetical protein